MTVQLKEKFEKEGVVLLQKAGANMHMLEVPRPVKVVVNIGVNAQVDKDAFKSITDDLALITGQRPLVTKARKSISNFKLREGMPIGAKVTLRGVRMFSFLERLIHVALPRVRDFRGVPGKGFDGFGNYTLGVREHTIFPEINPDRVKRVQGMDICLVTSAKDDVLARALLVQLGMPLLRSPNI